jgi:hypothetical protein
MQRVTQIVRYRSKGFSCFATTGGVFIGVISMASQVSHQEYLIDEAKKVNSAS